MLTDISARRDAFFRQVLACQAQAGNPTSNFAENSLTFTSGPIAGFANGSGTYAPCARETKVEVLDRTPPRGYNRVTIVRYNISRYDICRVLGFDGAVTNAPYIHYHLK